MKKLLTLILILSAGSLLAARSAAAQTASGAASSTISGAASSSAPTSSILEDVRTAIGSLISAKDTGNANDAALRVSAFRQVLALSVNEAKDYELKLVNVASGPAYETWKNAALAALAKALAYYDSEDRLLDGSSTITSARIQEIAGNFESWREAEYLPLVAQVQDFLLVQQEASAVQVAQSRYGKIVSDLQGLGSLAVANSQSIAADLADASGSISSAAALNRQADDLFQSLYLNASSSGAAASTTDAEASGTATSTFSLDVAPLDLSATDSPMGGASSSASTDAAATTTATTTAAGAASSTTATSTSPAGSSSTISIKGLVSQSLDSIRNAYQDFIDISNLVRKLLG